MKKNEANIEDWIDDNDPRFILVAEKCFRNINSFEYSKPKEGFEKLNYLNKIIKSIINLFNFVLLFFLIFSKPQWCIELGNMIDVY